MKLTPSKIWSRTKITSLYTASRSVDALMRLVASWLVFEWAEASLWGEFVKLNLIVHLASMFTGLGQRDFLIKLFSKSPKNTHADWGTGLASRLPLLALAGTCFFFFFDLTSALFLLLWLCGFHFNNAFQVLILYRRDFKMAVCVELIASSLLPLMVVMNYQNLSLYIIITGILSGFALRVLVYGYIYREYVKIKYLSFNKGHLKDSSMFFFPSLIGVVQSRIDTYFIAAYLESTYLAYYHVFMSFLNFSYNLVNYTIAPFIKNLYRIKFQSLRKFQNRYTIGSLVFGCIAMIATKIIIEQLYGYELPDLFYLAGMLNILAYSVYAVIINKLFRLDKQSYVAFTALFTLLPQTLLSFLIIPGYGLNGAFLVYALGQLIVTLTFIVLDKKFSKSAG